MIPLKSNQERMPEERITIYNCKGRSISELTPEDVRRAIENYRPGAEELVLHMYRLFEEAEKAGMKELIAVCDYSFEKKRETHSIGMFPAEKEGEVCLFLHNTRYYFSRFSSIKWEVYHMWLEFEREKLENNIVEFRPDKIFVVKGNNKELWGEYIHPKDIPEVKNLIEELLSEPYQLIVAVPKSIRA
jgi:hypothetical protein